MPPGCALFDGGSRQDVDGGLYGITEGNHGAVCDEAVISRLLITDSNMVTGCQNCCEISQCQNIGIGGSRKMIEINEITKSYGTHENRFQVLKGISTKIERGDFIVILGASGSGKSTLLNIISGLEYPDSGSVKYDGRDITELSDNELTAFRREKVGFIFQQYYLLPNMTVEKNVRMGADLAGNADYPDIIKAVGLEEKRKKYPGELSGGEQQRVAVARALAKRPEVLFLDEPTGALDEQTGRQVLDYICRLQREYPFTIVMVTHNLNIAEMAGTVIRMNSGRILETCTNKLQKNAYEIGW